MKKLTKIQQAALDKLQFKREHFGSHYYLAKFIGIAPKTLNSLVRLGLLETKIVHTTYYSLESDTFQTAYKFKEIKDAQEITGT